MQSTWYFLNLIMSENNQVDSSIAQLLRPIDILAILMASLGHDVGHPGVNNGFMASFIVLLSHEKRWYVKFYNIDHYCNTISCIIQ